MADNSSLVNGVWELPFEDQMVTVHTLVTIFLCINLLLIITFFTKECFYTTTRYILFAVTLFSDSFLLFVSNILIIFTQFYVRIQVYICLIICIVVLVYVTVTPVTLTAMTLERYVAICMPLRHGQLCSKRNTIICILIIHGISCVPVIVILSTFFATSSLSFYKQYHLCAVETFLFYLWQHHLRSAINQFQFFVLCVILGFCYVEIMKVAKAASGDDERKSKKGLKTVALHGFQLLLCLIQLWCTFIEAPLLQISFDVFNSVRYGNYIVFFLAPKCVSSLIYGLRDQVFFNALKNCVSRGLCNRHTI